MTKIRNRILVVSIISDIIGSKNCHKCQKTEVRITMKIARDHYLNELIKRKHNGMVKVITGIRRCGKSYLLNDLFYNHLLNAGIDRSHIIRFAFDSRDDLSLIGEDYFGVEKRKHKVNPNKFADYVYSKIEDDGMHYLLLDEVQNLEGFEYVLNDCLRKGNLDVYVTESNSRFLSTDVLTEFAGRGDEIHMLPLSFSEFCACQKGNPDEALDNYFVYGGLPAVALMDNDSLKVNYLKTQVQNVYLRDIVLRYKVKNRESLGELLDVLASGISTLVNPTKLANTFKCIKHEDLPDKTIAQYIGYMQDAFLIKTAKRYDVKGKKYISTPYKIYFEDVGLRNAELDFRQIEETHIMENVIFNELRYRGYNVDIGVVEKRTTLNGKTERKRYEVDFIANLGRRKYYIQSAYGIGNGEELSQEMNSFDQIGDSFKKIIVVNRTIKPRSTEKGYTIVGLKDFLLNADSLDY